MGFSINTNAGALVALQNLGTTNRRLNVVQNRINTGLKVSGAKDDASIFAIAQKQRAVLGGFSAVKDSLNRAVGGVDVALAGAEAISDLIIQMKEKAVSAADPGNDDPARAILNEDYQQLALQVQTIVLNAQFNGKNALRNDDINAIVGAEGSATNAIIIPAADLLPFANGLTILSLTSQPVAAITANSLGGFTDIVNGVLSKFGAGAKRLEIAGTFVEKISDAVEVGIGNLVDADLARESANLQSFQVKQQLGIQALAIANQAPQTVLSLFG